MCNRCGTGSIAWCTDPNRHEDGPEAIHARFEQILHEMLPEWDMGKIGSAAIADRLVDAIRQPSPAERAESDGQPPQVVDVVRAATEPRPFSAEYEAAYTEYLAAGAPGSWDQWLKARK